MLVYHEAFRPELLAAAGLMLAGNLINMRKPKAAGVN
jgi:hypothetical protein